MKLGRSRKGNLIYTTLMALIVIVIFTIVTMVAYKAYTDLAPDIKKDLDLNQSDDLIDDIDNRYPNIFQGAIIFVFLGFWGLLIISSFVSDNHPLLFGFMLVIQIFVIITSMILSNAYQELLADSAFTGLTASFGLVNFLIVNFLKLSIVFTVTAILIAFGKNKL